MTVEIWQQCIFDSLKQTNHHGFNGLPESQINFGSSILFSLKISKMVDSTGKHWEEILR